MSIAILHRIAITLAWAAIAMLSCGLARANAVSAEYAVGGLVFKPSSDITMASEELFLSMRQVRVDYVFHSSAATTQGLLLAFPLPVKPVEGVDGVYARNYLDFSVRVDGVPVDVHASDRALLSGRDVSQLLREAGLPLLFGVDMDSNRAVQALPAPVRQQLVAEGLVSQYPSHDATRPDDYSPQWEYQTVFEWRQDFAPGDTRVEIAYSPQLGDVVDFGGGEDAEYLQHVKRFEGYCIDDGMRRALSRHPAWQWDIYTLGYIVTTARYWNGPIGRFRLVVEKPSPRYLVAFCPLDAKKVSPTRFEWTRDNYVPAHDLKVMFFAPSGID